jgi:UDP-glucose 4-epimerase
MPVLVTGATGFIGRRLVNALVADASAVRALVRDPSLPKPWGVSGVSLYKGRLDEPGTLHGVCDGVETVYHLAGYAGPETVPNADGADRHWAITVEGTRALLKEALGSGVKRFVFVSSVKAMGEQTSGIADETSPTHPITHYGRAKRAAEELVLAANSTTLQTCVLRLPPVYGAGSRGNLSSMMAAVARGRFPALPSSTGKRSWVHVEDVVRALMLAGSHPAAAGKVYLVTDDHPLSAAEIYRFMREALKLAPMRWAMPLWALRAAAKVGDLVGTVTGRPVSFNSSTLTKLTTPAIFSSAKISRELSYRPKRTLTDSLAEMTITTVNR